MLKLTSINIEGGKHLDRVENFIKTHQPNVACFQEVFAVDIPELEDRLDMRAICFLQMARVIQPVSFMPHRGSWGIAIFIDKDVNIDSVDTFVYSQDDDEIPIMQEGNPNSCRRGVIVANCIVDKENYRIATTHLTWTPNGGVTETQLQHARNLLTYLGQYGDDLILCGDFNAPRGKATFQLFADRYQDTIPADITSTLDPELHRRGELPLVVDGMFLAAKYTTISTTVFFGVSDHKAIASTIKIKMKEDNVQQS